MGKKGFWTPPPVRYVFHPPQVSVLCFSCTKSTTEQTRSSFGGVQNFSGERVLWYVFLPPCVLHPPPHSTAQLRLKPFHLRGFQLIVLIFILSAGFLVFVLETETFLRVTPVIPQFRRYPGFQKEAVRVTPEMFNFSGVLQCFNHRRFLLTLSLPYGKPISSGD